MQENKLIGYVHDSNLMAVVPSPGVRVAVAESLDRGHRKINEWCDPPLEDKIECV